MNTLFDLGEPEPNKIEQKKRCRNCLFMLTHQWNSSFKYCAKQLSSRTAYGYKKIKANDPACGKFERDVSSSSK